MGPPHTENPLLLSGLARWGAGRGRFTELCFHACVYMLMSWEADSNTIFFFQKACDYLMIPVPIWGFTFDFFDIQYYLNSFRRTVQWLDIYTVYGVTPDKPPTRLIPIRGCYSVTVCVSCAVLQPQ